MHAGEDEDQFEQFMLPLTAAFEAVAQMFSTNTFNEQEAKVGPRVAQRKWNQSWTEKHELQQHPVEIQHICKHQKHHTLKIVDFCLFYVHQDI